MKKQTRARPIIDRERPRAQGALRTEVLDVIDVDTVLVRASKAPAAQILRAEIAAIGYVPVVGDIVIVEQGEDGWFVIGALGEARRRQVHAGLVATVHDGGIDLRVREGDLTLSASGRIVLRAGEVETTADLVRTTAIEVMTQAGRLEVDAGRLVERAGEAYRNVEGLSELQAGRARTLVEGAYHLMAKRASVVSDEDTMLDGKRVLLG